MSQHCFTGVRYEGNAEGTFNTIGGVKCYLATPAVDYAKEKVVIYLSDIFGIELANNQLLCDDFARNRFQVVAIDQFDGDPVPQGVMQTGMFDIGSWILKHGADVTRPRIDNVIAALKQRGVMEFAATGYCFGARYVFDLAFDGILKAAAISHPAYLNVPQDFHRFKETKVPLLINSCEVDHLFPADSQAQADAILGGGHVKADLYKREHFEGCAHGFAVRGDISNPKEKAGKDGAFKATVELFSEHL